jgi:hypothetical protein
MESMFSVIAQILLSQMHNTRRNCGNGEKKIYVEILMDLHFFITYEYENVLCVRQRKNVFFKAVYVHMYPPLISAWKVTFYPHSVLKSSFITSWYLANISLCRQNSPQINIEIWKVRVLQTGTKECVCYDLHNFTWLSYFLFQRHIFLMVLILHRSC